ncbi:MAG: RnfH family protein [Zetaproteobacteria bacterium CG_4_9_14_3_um_filter_49_83]|nr:MAG: RnfH family protein [Zetaproteobacteria bacterium CG1_02_49_23]PIQ30366.1 MAG: RnfH family protein [Zetaproteobacteria bacterium CG17_big_fil_post_rev_8_21_14_2_50_50_13]PIY54730.1 MAG: RnfH family protein [Zetaproteobacteria bacterium CG_4_10_14_0_8_um_filter_49_80]PJA34119.1 MAG: RnfH family protein [Zetaproteobacteria bacterium CG_4_9_14_3_um_filter_49_83]
MKVSLAVVENGKQIWQKLEVPENTTVQQVIKMSGILEQLHINLEEREVGIHGRLVELSSSLREGDRIEIYRPITADPATVKRRSIPTPQS